MNNSRLLEHFNAKFDTSSGLFDSHAHLSYPSKLSIDEVITNAKVAGVIAIVDVAVDLKTSLITLENHRRYPDYVYPTVGIHPELVVPGSDLFDSNIDEMSLDQIFEKLEQIIEQNRDKIVMIGECGIDYYWLEKSDLSSEDKERSKTTQREMFRRHLVLADKYSLPLTIHSRDSLDDCLEIINKSGLNLFGIFHSFTGNLDDATRIFERGFAIGINGIATYKSAQEIRDTVKSILGHGMHSPKTLYESGIFLETDAPFLLPRGSRGASNQSSNIKLIFDSVING